MTYRFRSRAAGDVLLLHPDGDAILRLMGRTPAARGIIEPAALPAAIAAIEKAAAVHDGAPPENDDDEVQLRQRTWPLLRLLKSAQAADSDVVWGA